MRDIIILVASFKKIKAVFSDVYTYNLKCFVRPLIFHYSSCTSLGLLYSFSFYFHILCTFKLRTSNYKWYRVNPLYYVLLMYVLYIRNAYINTYTYSNIVLNFYFYFNRDFLCIEVNNLSNIALQH